MGGHSPCPILILILGALCGDAFGTLRGVQSPPAALRRCNEVRTQLVHRASGIPSHHDNANASRAHLLPEDAPGRPGRRLHQFGSPKMPDPAKMMRVAENKMKDQLNQPVRVGNLSHQGVPQPPVLFTATHICYLQHRGLSCVLSPSCLHRQPPASAVDVPPQDLQKEVQSIMDTVTVRASLINACQYWCCGDSPLCYK